MNDELQKKIRDILKSQTATESPKLTRRVVLPPIGKSAESRSIPLDSQVPSTSSAMVLNYGRSISLGPSSSGYGTEELKDKLSNLTILEPHHSAPLIRRETPLPLDMDDIPENEILSRITTARERDDFDQTQLDVQVQQITVVSGVMAKMPDRLPVFSGLSTVLDNLSEHRLTRILEGCRFYDEEERGYLSQPSLLKCIGEVVPSAHSSSSPWRKVLQLLAPEGELLEYEKFLHLIEKYQTETQSASKVMKEIEQIIQENPEIDLDRLIHSTQKTVMSMAELNVLLELYGLKDHFESFEDTLFASFRTQEGLFHFSAFIGCIENLGCRTKPHLEGSARKTPG